MENNELKESVEESVNDALEIDIDFNNPDDTLTDYLYNETPSFVKLSDKYEDVLSSAYTMIFVGVVGIVLWFLLFFNIIHLGLNPSTSWLMYSVMGGMFIIFVIAGIVSFMHAKQIKQHAKHQDKLMDDIKKWASENIKLEDLKVEDESIPEELIYMEQTNKIQDLIMHQFEDADEAMAYELKDEIYEMLENK